MTRSQFPVKITQIYKRCILYFRSTLSTIKTKINIFSLGIILYIYTYFFFFQKSIILAALIETGR